MTDKIAAIKRNKTRDNLIAAYDSYTRKEPGSMDLLMKLVLKFAFTKVSHLEHEHSFKDFGSAETADDWAQEVSIKVWQGLTGAGNTKLFQGTGAQFYSWVHKIAFNRAAGAFNDLLEEKKTKVSLFVKNEEGEGDDHDGGDDESVENPLIHAEGPGYGSYTLIPASVQGIDRSICNLMLTEVQDQNKNGDYFMRGRNYAEVAQVLGMTEVAIRKQFQRLRDRVKAEDAKFKKGKL